MKVKKIRMERVVPVAVLAVMLLVSGFFLFFGNQAEANSGYLEEMKGYETVLIRKGDTLSSLTRRYAHEKSNYTEQEYMEAIIRLNDLPSGYLISGNYLLLPEY